MPIAFLLGLLVALNPCQLAISISALTFLTKHGAPASVVSARRTILLYVGGRSVSYVLLAWIIILALQPYMDYFMQSRLYQWVETALPFVLLAVAVFFLVRGLHPHLHHGECHHSGEVIHGRKRKGAFLMGLLLALAFCPESMVMYFGMMLPASFTSSAPLLVPVFFALGAAMPVLLVGWLMLRLASLAIHFSHRMELFQRILNFVFAGLFILLAFIILFAEK